MEPEVGTKIEAIPLLLLHYRFLCKTKIKMKQEAKSMPKLFGVSTHSTT